MTDRTIRAVLTALIASLFLCFDLAPAHAAGGDTNLVLFGGNIYGQLNAPTGIGKIKAISASTHNLAIKADGTVAAWGLNDRGQCNVPAGLSNVKAVRAATGSSVALKNDGTVVVWGNNQSGQMNVPAGLSGVKDIAVGNNYVAAVKSDGTVVAWGRNPSGELNIPAGLSNVVALAGGPAHVVALKADGTVVAWGYNGYGSCNVPAGLSNVKAIAAAGDAGLALKTDGTLVMWGDGYTPPAGLSNVVAISMSLYTVGVVKADGTVMVWGSNPYGQTTLPSPLAAVESISVGPHHTALITDSSAPTFSGINAGSAAKVNRRGEYCSNAQFMRVTIEGGQDLSGIKEVRFHVRGSTYPSYATQDYVFLGTQDWQGNWYVDLDMDSLPAMDFYRVQAFPVDNLGNSQEATMLWNDAYPTKVTLRREKVAPIAYGHLEAASAGASFITSTPIPVTNSSVVRVKVDAYETGYSNSGVKSVTLSLIRVSDSTSATISARTLFPAGADANGDGAYAVNVSLANYAGTETKFIARTTVRDFAGNFTVTDQPFIFDGKSPRGMLAVVGPSTTTASTVDYTFTVSSDAAGLMGPPEFYIWTTANEQDDLQLVYGQQVPGTPNVWKATVRRSDHSYSNGEYNIHVWTRDALGNFNYAAAQTLQMQ